MLRTRYTRTAELVILVLMLLSPRAFAQAPQNRASPRDITLRGQVELLAGDPANQRLLVVTTGEGVAESAYARPDEEGNFELEVKATGGTIGLDLWSRHLYLDAPVSVDPDSANRILLPAKYGVFITVQVSTAGGWDEQKIVETGIQIHALRDGEVLRRAYRSHRQPTPSVSRIQYELRGVPPGPGLSLRMRTREYPEFLIDVPDSDIEGIELLTPGSSYNVTMHASAGHRLFGKVVDPEGNGVAGAKVTLTEDSLGCLGYAVPYYEEFQTGSDGAFDELWRRGTRFGVHVQAQGYRDLYFVLEDQAPLKAPTPQIWELKSFPTLEGWLLLPGGQPAAGYKVHYEQKWKGRSAWSSPVTAHRVTGANGEFAIIDRNPEVTYRLYASASPGGELLQAVCEHATADQKDLELQLAPQRTPVGRIVDLQGSPITKFAVTIRPLPLPSGQYDWTRTCTRHFENEEGRFELPSLEFLPCEVIAHAEGFASASASAWRIESGDTAVHHEFVVARHSEIHGRLIHSEGEEAARARIRILQVEGEGAPSPRAWKSAQGGLCNEEGEFAFSLARPGRYQIWSELRGNRNSEVTEVLLGPGELRRGIQIHTLPLSTVSGRFHPSPGEQITGTVFLRSVESSEVLKSALDSNLRFGFDHVAPGTYQLVREDGTNRPVFADWIEVARGQDLEVQYGDRERERYPLKVRILQAGAPLRDAPLRVITQLDGEEYRAVTDDRGEAQLHPVAKHTVEIFVTLAELGIEVSYLEFIKLDKDGPHVWYAHLGDAEPEVTIDIPKGFLRGRVLLANGEPAADVALHFKGPSKITWSRERRYARTGANGEFLFAGVLDGECSITVSGTPGRDLETKCFESLEVRGQDLDPCDHELRLDSSR